jgi:hypothetical protein
LKLVRVGLKVAQKWGDKKLYVIVENDNIGAIKFYEKLKFSCVKKEEDSIYRRMDRAPRIFMCIDVPEKASASVSASVGVAVSADVGVAVAVDKND